ncbi:hypothetical protein VTP01DRAFT_957 [Rhizomucor pusillus]|uniref:uncharacterized protein n=1 Tax=Rhizomucor pusillus TaxID=4840 RepID=UPI003743F538
MYCSDCRLSPAGYIFQRPATYRAHRERDRLRGLEDAAISRSENDKAMILHGVINDDNVMEIDVADGNDMIIYEQ